MWCWNNWNSQLGKIKSEQQLGKLELHAETWQTTVNVLLMVRLLIKAANSCIAHQFIGSAADSA